jgi:hypothetical protein
VAALLVLWLLLDLPQAQRNEQDVWTV